MRFFRGFEIMLRKSVLVLRKVTLLEMLRDLFHQINRLLNWTNVIRKVKWSDLHSWAWLMASLHNPKFEGFYKKDVANRSKGIRSWDDKLYYVETLWIRYIRKSYSIYGQGGTKKLSRLSDKELEDSMKRVHQTSKNRFQLLKFTHAPWNENCQSQWI